MPQSTDLDLSISQEITDAVDLSRQRLRKNVELMFLGLTTEETAPLLALLRTSRISPRGHKINSEKAFLDALGERSWDLIICSPTASKFSAMDAVIHLKRLGKDIPIIQLIPKADSKRQLHGFKNRIHAVVPLDEKELLVIQIRKELENLDNRRQLRRAKAALAEAEKRNIELMDSSKNAIACCDAQQVVYANESFYDLFGEIEAEQVLGKEITDWFIQSNKEQLQRQLKALSEGNLAEELIQLTGLRSDQSEFVANLELTTTVYKEQQVTQVLLRGDDHHVGNVFNDDLNLVSGLLNKDFLYRQLEKIIQKALTGGNDCGLLYITLQDFSDFSNAYGQECAERYVRDISSLLQEQVNKPHLLAHLEDNVFVVIFFEPNADKTQRFAEKLHKQVTRHNTKISGNNLQGSCVIGITLINDSSPPADELLSRAASAAREIESRTNPDEQINFFSSSTPFDQDCEEMKRLCRAVEDKELKLLFQPVVNLAADNQTELHYEVLLRLMEAEDVEISPNEFRNAMKDPETVIKVDRWVIENSLIPLKATLENKQKNVLFINISVHGMGDKELLSWLSGVLDKHVIPPEQIVFQISNSDVAMAPKQARFFAKFLHKIHCRICIKHFGSAPYDREVLKKINADYIKLDGSYIQELGSDKKQDEQFLSLVKGLSEMGKITIAPLVEDTRAMVTLWKAGVSYVQGYYLQPPREQMDYDFFRE